jgi:NADH-quinone oxidoreductase subunit M
MILIWLIVILMGGGLAAWISGYRSDRWPRWISLLAVSMVTVLSIWTWLQHSTEPVLSSNGSWWLEFNWEWLPQFGINFHLALDGLSMLLIVLTSFLGVLSVLTSWTEIQYKVGFFHFNLLWILAGIMGVFLAVDLFLFYFFWEVMLIPMYFLIGIWGHENRIYAAIKFFIFTQASGLLMLLSILGLYFIHGRLTGIYTFDYTHLLDTVMAPATARWLMLGFLIAFIVKLPAIPFHTWLPDAHTEAPTAGSVILAGLLLKTGAYGILRYVIPLFPQAAIDFAPAAMILGAAGIIYGAKLAFAQTDMKRMVAYTSVSHMGFVLLGAFAFNMLAWQGVVMQMLAHGISTGALFIIAGMVKERLHTRDMQEMGGLWENVPRLAGISMLFAMASLGLPGLGNFVAEMLVLFGAYMADKLMTIIATIGLVAATLYSLWFIQQVFHGPKRKEYTVHDLSLREMLILVPMILVIIWLGFYPQPVIQTVKPVLQQVQTAVESHSAVHQQPSPGGCGVCFHAKEEKAGCRCMSGGGLDRE